MTLPERARSVCESIYVRKDGIHYNLILAALEETRREARLETAEEAAQYVHELWECGNAAAEFSELLRREFIDNPEKVKPASLSTDGPSGIAVD